MGTVKKTLKDLDTDVFTDDDDEKFVADSDTEDMEEESPVTKQIVSESTLNSFSKMTDKLSTSDRKVINAMVKNMVQDFTTEINTLVQTFKTNIETCIMTSNKNPTSKVSKKAAPIQSYSLDVINPKFKKIFLEKYKNKNTITQKDIFNLIYPLAFNDDYLILNSEYYDALCLDKNEKKILNTLKDQTSPLNINRSDNKVLLNKIITNPTKFQIKGVEYDAKNPNLWDDMIKNGIITVFSKINKDNTSDSEQMFNISTEYGEALKTAFNKKPSFLGKKVVKKAFDEFINSVTHKNVSIYYEIPAANEAILTHFGVAYVKIDGVLYTKQSLLKKTIASKFNSSTRKFEDDTFTFLQNTLTGIDLTKVKLDDVVTHCLYTNTNNE